jgi:hypothetical protein
MRRSEAGDRKEERRNGRERGEEPQKAAAWEDSETNARKGKKKGEEKGAWVAGREGRSTAVMGDVENRKKTWCKGGGR